MSRVVERRIFLRPPTGDPLMVWPFSRRNAAPVPSTRRSAKGCVALQLESDGMPEIWFIDATLDQFAERASFPWHLSLIIQLEDVHAGVGIPTPDEHKLATNIREELESGLMTNDNAHFLGSVTWNGTRQLLYRVRDAEAANAVLRSMVEDPSAPRAMEYVMQKDSEWAHAETYLGAVRAAASSNAPVSRIVREGGKVRVVDA